MNKSIIKVLLIIVIVTVSILGADTVLAEYKLLETLPGVAKETESTTFPQYVTGIYKFALGIVSISALLMIVIGGFYYIASAGNQAQASTAKKIITDAILGLIVVFLAVLILNVINPDLLKSNPSMEALQDITITTKSTVDRKKIQRSSTHCRNIDGNIKCFNTKQECEGAAGPSQVASSCRKLQNSFSNSKYYYEDENGNITEMSIANCEAAAIDGGTCLSGTAVKGTKFYTLKSEAEIRASLLESGVTVANGVDVSGLPPVTENAVKNIGEPHCEGDCDKKIIYTEGVGSNIADIADNSGTFFDSRLVNSIQRDAVRGRTEKETLPGGDLFTKRVRKTTTYTYPEGHEQAGQVCQIIQEGFQTRGPGGLIPGSFAPSSSRVRVYGEKDTPPSVPEVDDDLDYYNDDDY